MSLVFQLLRAASEDRAKGKGAQQGSGQYLEHLAPGASWNRVVANPIDMCSVPASLRRREPTSPPKWPPMEMPGTPNVNNKLITRIVTIPLCQMLMPIER